MVTLRLLLMTVRLTLVVRLQQMTAVLKSSVSPQLALMMLLLALAKLVMVVLNLALAALVTVMLQLTLVVLVMVVLKPALVALATVILQPALVTLHHPAVLVLQRSPQSPRLLAQLPLKTHLAI